MWNIPINIITATKYQMIKLFHESDNTDIVVTANGYYGTSTKCTHYTATELIVPDQNKVPGNATPYDDLIPVNLTRQLEAHKSTISYAQCHTQDHILTEFHNISRGMVILKGEMKKMDTRTSNWPASESHIFSSSLYLVSIFFISPFSITIPLLMLWNSVRI